MMQSRGIVQVLRVILALGLVAGYWPEVFAERSVYEPAVAAVPLLYAQFESLGQRLTTLHTKRAELKAKYQGYDESFLADIDSDIVRLSKMGMQLANLTIRFYDAVEPGIIRASQNLDVLGARTAALTGLKDFTADIDKANRMVAAAGSDTSLADVLRQVDQAVRELERAVGQSDRRPSR